MSTVAIPACLESLVDFLNSLDERVPLDELEWHLKNLDVSLEDLAPFLHFNDRCYQRNLVCQGQWFELLCICWKEDQSSAIHNHEGSSCGVRIVSGRALERRFDVDGQNRISEAGQSWYDEGDVCCTQDSDVHQVCNVQGPGSRLVTLHVYSPPLANMCTWPEDSLQKPR